MLCHYIFMTMYLSLEASGIVTVTKWTLDGHKLVRRRGSKYERKDTETVSHMHTGVVLNQF